MNGGAVHVTGNAEHIDGLRSLARLLLVAKAPLYDVDVALDVLVNRTCVPRYCPVRGLYCCPRNGHVHATG